VLNLIFNLIFFGKNDLRVKIKLQVKKATFVAVFLGNTLELLALYSRKQKKIHSISLQYFQIR
jgi:hypothetical protein